MSVEPLCDVTLENLASAQLAEILEKIDAVIYEHPTTGAIKLTAIGSHTLHDVSCSIAAPKAKR